LCRTIRAVGEEAIPMLEWRFWPDFFWDDQIGYYTVEGRGGAHYRAFD
jgi:mannonate dehydratase